MADTDNPLRTLEITTQQLGGVVVPAHVTGFQILVDNADVAIVFNGRQFAYSTSGGDTPEVRQAPVATISISHMLAKNLLQKLGASIAEFEKKYGTIPDLV